MGVMWDAVNLRNRRGRCPKLSLPCLFGRKTARNVEGGEVRKVEGEKCEKRVACGHVRDCLNALIRCPVQNNLSLSPLRKISVDVLSMQKSSEDQFFLRHRLHA